MNQDSYFHVKRFGLVDRVPTIEIYVPGHTAVRIVWDYSNEYNGFHTITNHVDVFDNNRTIHGPFPVKPGLSVSVDIETLFGNFNGILTAEPTDKADEPN